MWSPRQNKQQVKKWKILKNATLFPKQAQTKHTTAHISAPMVSCFSSARRLLITHQFGAVQEWLGASMTSLLIYKSKYPKEKDKNMGNTWDVWGCQNLCGGSPRSSDFPSLGNLIRGQKARSRKERGWGLQGRQQNYSPSQFYLPGQKT